MLARDYRLLPRKPILWFLPSSQPAPSSQQHEEQRNAREHFLIALVNNVSGFPVCGVADRLGGCPDV
ncbi:hypothetical protein E2C01_010966 [Portunus trituberculatus]|uniref:Uncharacterized protein n=1 Tax=Portunus trituberculatus TaxID=210409 RepID=A0A5B7DA01_PORTR|nr:hypothetical protein [Portunus trituberculatus]